MLVVHSENERTVFELIDSCSMVAFAVYTNDIPPNEYY